MKYLPYIVLVLLSVIIYINHKEQEAREMMFRKMLKEYELRQMQLLLTIDSLEKEYDYLAIHYKNTSNAYINANKELEKLKLRYETRRKKRPINSDAAYDSILNVLYAR
ncbi:MAG: hypothetical protein KatS3mg031_2954 [Chitinophagales bacterium]|nr:MAG: hypothetical protein KatS3mg031_2954 [Chitinophagales bacterium]